MRCQGNPMTTNPHRARASTVAAAAACVALLVPAGDVRSQPRGKDAGKKYALLVGCTVYPYAKKLRELYGPENDVKLLARLLSERFGFAEADIHRLAGWPDDPARRPTYANIVAGFKDLVRKAEP